MSETGGLDVGTPSEGQSGAPEQLSEDAKQRFAAAGAAMAQIRREEKKSKKRDAKVAKTILQFLNDDKHAHLFVLISRLVARDCPSIFILAILSLINEESLKVVDEYFVDDKEKAPQTESVELAPGAIDKQANDLLIAWINRMQMVLSSDTNAILAKIMVDEHNVDGTVLQLTTFVLQEFFESDAGGRRKAPFEQVQTLTLSILQTVFEPFLEAFDRSLLPGGNRKDDDDEDDE
jgi:hypothetical protein